MKDLISKLYVHGGVRIFKTPMEKKQNTKRKYERNERQMVDKTSEGTGTKNRLCPSLFF